MEVKPYRIIINTAYDGCIPVMVYVVQKAVPGFRWYKWVNIKAFQNREKAYELLRLLQS